MTHATTLASPKTTAQKASKTKRSARTKVKLSVEEILSFILKFLDDGKAQDVLSIDLKGKTSLADYLVVASGSSTRQVNALAVTLAEKLKEMHISCHIEGKQGTGEWMIIDLGDIIVHIFHPDTRAFYEIEELWGVKTPVQK